jgi:hypothetical protein
LFQDEMIKFVPARPRNLPWVTPESSNYKRDRLPARSS